MTRLHGQPTIFDPNKNDSSLAFKGGVESLKLRNEQGGNKLMELGGNVDASVRKRPKDMNNVNNKPSRPEDMYHMDQALNMLHRRVIDDYPTYGKDGSFRRAYADPLQSSPAKKHLQQDLMSRTVTQVSSMKKKMLISEAQALSIQRLVLDKKVKDSKYFDIIKMWNQRQVDFRILQNFKNLLYGSPYLLTAENKLPVSEFERIRRDHDSFTIRGPDILGYPPKKGILKGQFEQHAPHLEPAANLLKEITDPETSLVDLSMFSDILDLFMYLPNKEKANDFLSSPEIHSILSPRLQKSGHKNGAKANDRNPFTPLANSSATCSSLMDEIWTRVQERFNGMSAAFRFFDRNYNGQITFDSFVISLEVLRLRLSAKDQMQVFNALDQNKKGYIDYRDFCGLNQDADKPTKSKKEQDLAAALLREHRQGFRLPQSSLGISTQNQQIHYNLFENRNDPMLDF